MDVVIIIVNIVIITILTFALGLFSSFQPLLLLPLCTRASWTGNLENMLDCTNQTEPKILQLEVHITNIQRLHC